VSDNGCGMDAATQRRVFEPFFTTKFTGRGLGMSAVLGIITSHNGALQLSSSPGAGTSFKIRFPLCVTPSAAAVIPSVASMSQAQQIGTILLVDDEKALRIIGSSMLKKMGFSTITACNGREALEILSKQDCSIDLVLLDMIMPEMGGVEAYHELRKRSPHLPVVMCSGYSIEGFSLDLDKDKHTGCIQKPYKPDQLRDVIMKVLGRENV
jgi:CheY-like chemotaxis protein